MKKSILNIGIALEKKEQRQINGGNPPGGLTPPQECNGNGYLEPFDQAGCAFFGFIWHEGRCWSCA